MNKKSEQPWWLPGITVFAEVTGWIAVPIVGALYLGRYLDGHYGTDPWWYLGLTGLAIIVTSVGIVRIGGKYIKQMEQDKNNESNNRNNRTR